MGMGGHLTFEQQQNSRTQNINAYGTLNDREEMNAAMDDTPASQTQRVAGGGEMGSYRKDNSKNGSSPGSPEHDGKAAPSIPPNMQNSDEENVFSLQRADSHTGNGPRIVQPSEWGAPDSSYRTKDLDGAAERFKVESQQTQISRSEFTSNVNYEGGDRSASLARQDSQEVARLQSELRLVKSELDRCAVERDALSGELREV
jgi:hypothetical protein